jgi:two-component system, cell cycle sensor histidine kinase and response regulator CckA
VVLGIVRAHDGGIAVESNPDRGSAFRIYFPVSVETVPIPLEKAQEIPEIAESGSVLLIEDEDQVRNLAKIMLIRMGYKVLEAKDGMEAIEIFQQHQDEVRCVLSDLTMPRMSGWDTLAALRKLSPGIPVILSSGYDEAQVMAVEHTERPNAFLGKPYQLKGLRETVRRVLTANAHL